MSDSKEKMASRYSWILNVNLQEGISRDTGGCRFLSEPSCDWLVGVLSKHDTISQCWFNVDPPSQTVGQRQTSIGWMCFVRCEAQRDVDGNQYGSAGTRRFLLGLCDEVTDPNTTSIKHVIAMQKLVNDYLKNRQLLAFGFARQNTRSWYRGCSVLGRHRKYYTSIESTYILRRYASAF